MDSTDTGREAQPTSRADRPVAVERGDTRHPARPVWIVTILRSTGPTGVHTHFREFMRFLEAAGVPTELVNSFATPALLLPALALRRLIERLSRPAGVRWHEAVHGMVLRRILRRRLRGGDPVILYAQCPVSAEAALQARTNADQRVVLIVHFNISQAFEWAGRGSIREGDPVWRRILAREARVLPRVDGLVFVSEFMKRAVLERIPGIAGVPTAVIPNFLAPQPGSASTPDLPPTDLVAIGTLEPRKNQAYLLEIIAAAKRQGHPLSLTLIGDGPDRARLAGLAVRLEIEALVHFAGFVADARAALPRYRALVHAARMESFGIVLIEAMSQGLPVFAPAVGGMREVFDDGVEGWALPQDDAQSAASFITLILSDAHALNAAGTAAKHRFERDFGTMANATRLRYFLNGAT